MKKYLFVGVTLFASSYLWANENGSYLCVADQSTGFIFESDSWKIAYFDVSEVKFIVRPLNEKESSAFKSRNYNGGVFRMGNTAPSYKCRIGEDTGSYNCSYGIGEFFFSPETNRFIQTYTAGYWDGVEDGSETPNITRGVVRPSSRRITRQ